MLAEMGDVEGAEVEAVNTHRTHTLSHAHERARIAAGLQRGADAG